MLLLGQGRQAHSTDTEATTPPARFASKSGARRRRSGRPCAGTATTQPAARKILARGVRGGGDAREKERGGEVSCAHTHTHTDACLTHRRKQDKQTNKHTQTNKESNKQTNKQASKQTNKKERKKERANTNNQSSKQTSKQTYIHTQRHCWLGRWVCVLSGILLDELDERFPELVLEART